MEFREVKEVSKPIQKEEKRFVLKHVFNDVEDFDEGEDHYSVQANHFNVDSYIMVQRLDGHLAVFFQICGRKNEIEWAVETKGELKIFGKNQKREVKSIDHKFLKFDDVKNEYLINGILTKLKRDTSVKSMDDWLIRQARDEFGLSEEQVNHLYAVAAGLLEEDQYPRLMQELHDLENQENNDPNWEQGIGLQNEEARVRELWEEARVLEEQNRIEREENRNLQKELRIVEEQQRNLEQALQNMIRDDLEEAKRVFQEDRQWFQQIRRESEALQRNPALARNRRDPQLQMVGVQRRQRRLENPNQRRQPGQNLVIPMEIEIGRNAGNADADNANDGNFIFV
ncbi:unnamed protein product [Caenorhabditis nigoni]